MKRRAFLALTASLAGTAGARPSALERARRHIGEFVLTQPVRGMSFCLGEPGLPGESIVRGKADAEGRLDVLPGHRFRIASISKPLTLAALCGLLESGSLSLEGKVAEILDLARRFGPPRDARWERITIGHLIRHEGGFDRAVSGDPMFRSEKIASEFGVPPPPAFEPILRHLWARPLDFAPGERTAYSNFGYGLLGRVMERVSGKPYGDLMSERLLGPLGMRATALGRTRTALPDEVQYDEPGRPAQRSVFADDAGRPVPAPYGGWCLETMDAHGGWVSTAADLCRFGAALLARPRPDCLSSRHVEAFFRTDYVFFGALDGTSSVLHVGRDGRVWAALFNRRRAANGQDLATVFEQGLVKALA